MNNRKIAILTYVMTIFLIAVTQVNAQADPLLEATLFVDDTTYTVGDPIHLTLSVVHPAGYQVIFPKLDSNWGEFIVKSVSPPSTTPNDNGTETSSQVIDVRLFSTGSFTTPPLEITVSDSEGNLNEITAAPLEILVASVLIKGDNQLRDIKPQAEMPFFNIWPWIISLTFFVLVIGGFGYLRTRHRARKQLAEVDKRLPHEVASDELDRIEGLNLPGSGNFKEHYTLTSNCIRLYLEKTFEIPFLERATYEIQSNLKGRDISHDLLDKILGFLFDSDLVKFSKFTPDMTSSYELILRGRHIIELTKTEIMGIDDDDIKNISQTIEGNPNSTTKKFNNSIEVTT
jgi:hypothetical protein